MRNNLEHIAAVHKSFDKSHDSIDANSTDEINDPLQSFWQTTISIAIMIKFMNIGMLLSVFKTDESASVIQYDF